MNDLQSDKRTQASRSPGHWQDRLAISTGLPTLTFCAKAETVLFWTLSPRSPCGVEVGEPGRPRTRL